MRVKLKKVSKLRSIPVSHTLGRGREIHYKSRCPADFDMLLKSESCNDLPLNHPVKVDLAKTQFIVSQAYNFNNRVNNNSSILK